MSENFEKQSDEAPSVLQKAMTQFVEQLWAVARGTTKISKESDPQLSRPISAEHMSNLQNQYSEAQRRLLEQTYELQALRAARSAIVTALQNAGLAPPGSVSIAPAAVAATINNLIAKVQRADSLGEKLEQIEDIARKARCGGVGDPSYEDDEPIDDPSSLDDEPEEDSDC